MSLAAKSIFYWGWWCVLGGAGFLLFPSLFSALGGFPSEAEILIRIMGIMLCVLSCFYFVMCRITEAWPIWLASVFTRTGAFAIVVFLVLFGAAKPILLPFLLIDLFAGIFTGYAIYLERRPHLITK